MQPRRRAMRAVTVRVVGRAGGECRRAAAFQRDAEPQITPLPMIDASARLNADGRALAYPIHGGDDRATEALDNGGEGVTTLADPAETTRNTDPSATRELHDLLRRAEGEYR